MRRYATKQSIGEVRSMVLWKELDSNDFQEFLDTNDLAIVLFYSSHDRFTIPAQEILQETVEGLDFPKEIGKVEVDGDFELIDKYKINSIPCIIFFVNGEFIDFITGIVDEDALMSMLMTCAVKLGEQKSE